MSNAYARTEIRTSLVCLLCARVAGTIQAGVVVTDHPEHVRCLRCPHCNGRLWEQDAQPVLVLLPLPREELYSGRGRPPRHVILPAREARPARPALDRLACATCGSAFRQRNRTQRYCSVSCGVQARCPRAAERPCMACGEPYRPKNGRQRFCSCGCSGAARRRALPHALCAWCGVPFTPCKASQRSCSSACAMRLRHHRGRKAVAS